jgi:hypothetical protein
VGAPEGNKNALVHGLYERLGYEAMSEEELEIAASLRKSLEVPEGAPQEEDAYILLTIWERRMLERLEALEETGDEGRARRAKRALGTLAVRRGWLHYRIARLRLAEYVRRRLLAAGDAQDSFS